MIQRDKVFAYITRGSDLLVFQHLGNPDAGVQVPAGTVEEGERLEEAVMREAEEETGLKRLKKVGLLGTQRRDMRDYSIEEVHNRHFFHLVCEEEAPDRWHNVERHRSDGGEPITFDLYWVRLPDGVPELYGEHGYLLSELLAKMGLRGN